MADGFVFFVQAEDGIRDLVRSRGLGDVYKRQVLLLSVGLIAWWLVASTRKAAVVPSKGQWITEQVYGLVRNSIAKDVIGSHDFLKFVPLLFTMFTLILVNNLFGIIPPIQYPTMSRIGFPMALTLIVYVVYHCLLYTSDAADARSSVDLGGRRIIKKKKN